MGLPNLSGQHDVYGSADSAAAEVAGMAEIGLTVLLEPSPGALARVFALLATFDLVPLASCSTLLPADYVRLDLTLHPVPHERCEMLVRKLNQMIDCIEVKSAPRVNAASFVFAAA